MYKRKKKLPPPDTRTNANSKEISDGKKKLALALGALGVTAAVGAGIAMNAKKGQLQKGADSVKTVLDNNTEKWQPNFKKINIKRNKNFKNYSESFYRAKSPSHTGYDVYLKQRGTLSNPNFKNGQTIELEKITNLSTGKLESIKDTSIKPRQPHFVKGHVTLPNGERCCAKYINPAEETGRDGLPEIVSITRGKFDKKSGILTQTEEFCRKTKDGIKIHDMDKSPTRKIITNKKTGNQLAFRYDPEYREVLADAEYIKGGKPISGFRLDGEQILEHIVDDTAIREEVLSKYLL